MKNRYRLGLDVGTNSLGWCVLELGNTNNPTRIEAAGVRIFSDGRDEQSKATLAATRREKRSARRLRDRFKQRQAYLLQELTDAGLFPKDGQQRKELEKLNPLELRAKALTERLTPHEVGRALFHLNQRRGFKSNRKDRSEEATSGVVSRSVRKLLEEMDLIAPPLSKEQYKELSKEKKKAARLKEAEDRQKALTALSDKVELTYGSFLWKRQQDGLPVRARRGAGADGKLYDVYPTRELYKDEFNKIWAAQKKHHSNLMTPEKRSRIHNVIFTQRPLKPQKRGRCIYIQDEDRTFRAMPSFQRYRIYQEVNNLEESLGKIKIRDYRDIRDKIVTMLEEPSSKDEPTPRNGKISFHKMKKVLKDNGLVKGQIRFNFETQGCKGFDGNLTSHVMQHEDYVGSDWHKWTLEKQDSFIKIILDDELDDEQVVQRLKSQYDLPETSARKCMAAPLVEGTANISLKAARLMLEKMEKGVVHHETGESILPLQHEAAQAVSQEHSDEFINPMRQRKTDMETYIPEDRLPYYGEAFRDGRHIIPGSYEDEDKGNDYLYYGGVTNPTVHIALNQIRKVVNELIGRYGHPFSIAIELGRNLPAGPDGRKKIKKEQADNQSVNEKLDKILNEHGQMPNRDNRLRLRLWKELNEKDINGRCCPFSGKKIGITDLFNGNAEIEHLIPFSQSLDNSRANKVICTRQANRDKGNQTPFEAFGQSPDGYDWADIQERVKRLSNAKQRRFREDAMEIWNRDHQDFSERHLNDTGYIGRLTREYLECICHIDKIDVVTGRLTGLLRGHWGLNKVLDQSGGAKKNRDDHRHHAVDAIVVGMTSRAMLQKVATAANRAEELKIDQLFEKGTDGKSAIDPWNGFRSHVRDIIGKIIVSHKVKRTRQGELHEANAFRILSEPDEKGRHKIIRRKFIDDFKDKKNKSKALEQKRLETIYDEHLRDAFISAFDDGGHDAIIALAKQKKIRRLRTVERAKVIQIKDKKGHVKAYKGGNNWAMEIYSFPKGHKEANKWEVVVISRFDANRPDFKQGQSYRPHPAAKLVMRLQKNDCLEIKENGEKHIVRVQKMTKDELTLAPLHEANVDARHRDEEDSFKFLRKKPNKLKPLNAKKVHISPTGRVSYEKR